MLYTKKMNAAKNRQEGAISVIPDIDNMKVVMGFWHNWPGEFGQGYQGGRSTDMQLVDIPKQYNVVAVAFMKGVGIPTFKPYNVPDAEFRRQIDELHKQGRIVLISLGGADAHIELRQAQLGAFVDELKRLVTVYNFDGLDIDLEQSAITAAENQTVIPQALREVKDYYRTMGRNFIISMAPEFPYLRNNEKYQAYINSLEGYYDLVAPQYYNQGGDGIWVDELNAWITQNNDAQKENFLYYLTDSLIHGTRGYIAIPANKLAIGLPSNRDAAATGYVINPTDALNALKRLEQAGNPIKGLMTWSVNWDNGLSKDSTPYNWEFINRYGHITGEAPPEPSEKPSTPAGLKSTQQTTNSITLQWQPSNGLNPISFYTLYRNDQPLSSRITPTSFTDSGLSANTEYRYRVSATDTKNNTSELSASLLVKTQSEAVPVPGWGVSTWYNDHDSVSYRGAEYICLMQHTSNKYWTPDRANTLWALVSWV